MHERGADEPVIFSLRYFDTDTSGVISASEFKGALAKLKGETHVVFTHQNKSRAGVVFFVVATARLLC